MSALRLLPEISFARPALLVALVLPLVAWWLARRPRPPEDELTGALALWRALGPPADSNGRRPPLPRALLLALLLGALALSGPRLGRPAAGPWTVVVDRSPSMYLPHDAGGTRLERALALAEELLAELGVGARVWVAAEGEHLLWDEAGSWDEAAPDVRPAPAAPQSWGTAPERPWAEPAWPAFDLPRTLWVSDADPGAEPRAAALALCGGGAVPGPAAAGRGGELLVFDGERLVPSGERLPAQTVRIDPGLAAPVRELVELWAAARDLAPVDSAARADLEVLGPAPGAAGGERAERLLARAGFALELASVPTGLGPRGFGPAREWRAESGEVLVRASPGRVELAFDDAREPEGDRAAFAVAWSELLDGALPAPAGLIPVLERLDAGSPRTASPPSATQQGQLRSAAGSAERRSGAGGDARPEAVLALAAALCALVAASSGVSAPRGRRGGA